MGTDLSENHGLVSSLFNSASAEERSLLKLSSSQLADFERDGFIAPVRLFNDAQIAVLRDELADLMQPGHEGHELWYEHHSNESSEAGATLFHALGAWRLRPGLHDVLWNPPFTTAAKQLLGGPVRFLAMTNFSASRPSMAAWSPGTRTTATGTQTVPMQHLTCWVGLDDSTTENGCLHYVPGSHKWPLLPRTDLANNMEAILEVLSPEQLAAFKPVPCELKAGEASFHHSAHAPRKPCQPE